VDIVFRVDAAKLAQNDENSKEITLHAKELCIASAEYKVVEGGDSSDDDAATAAVTADEILVNVKATTVKFVFGQAIPATATKIQLSIQFTGFLNNQMCVLNSLLIFMVALLFDCALTYLFGCFLHI